jgi:hypothetical protein
MRVINRGLFLRQNPLDQGLRVLTLKLVLRHQLINLRLQRLIVLRYIPRSPLHTAQVNIVRVLELSRVHRADGLLLAVEGGELLEEVLNLS